MQTAWQNFAELKCQMLNMQSAICREQETMLRVKQLIAESLFEARELVSHVKAVAAEIVQQQTEMDQEEMDQEVGDLQNLQESFFCMLAAYGSEERERAFSSWKEKEVKEEIGLPSRSGFEGFELRDHGISVRSHNLLVALLKVLACCIGRLDAEFRVELNDRIDAVSRELQQVFSAEIAARVPPTADFQGFQSELADVTTRIGLLEAKMFGVATEISAPAKISGTASFVEATTPPSSHLLEGLTAGALSPVCSWTSRAFSTVPPDLNASKDANEEETQALGQPSDPACTCMPPKEAFGQKSSDVLSDSIRDRLEDLVHAVNRTLQSEAHNMTAKHRTRIGPGAPSSSTDAHSRIVCFSPRPVPIDGPSRQHASRTCASLRQPESATLQREKSPLPTRSVPGNMVPCQTMSHVPLQTMSHAPRQTMSNVPLQMSPRVLNQTSGVPTVLRRMAPSSLAGTS